jgi:enterochelin esterase family protein
MTKTLTATFLLLAGVLAADETSPKLSLPEMPEPTFGADSMVKAGIPKGKVTDFVFSDSKVFEGTKRRIHLYIPAQYDPKKETAVMVFQDGHTYVNPKGEFRVTTVTTNTSGATTATVASTWARFSRKP